jgi:pimeloyl-ACP methyl ester carboxylesterase
MEEQPMMPTPSTTPTGDHTLTRPDGRRVAWSEWGNGKGPPVLLLHRNPGSRLLDPDSAATTASAVHLITIDRPGYGGTDPAADPTPEAVSSDVVWMVDVLRLPEVALDWIGPEHGHWYAARLADAQLTVVRGAGHLLPVTNWRLILDAALTA